MRLRSDYGINYIELTSNHACYFIETTGTKPSLRFGIRSDSQRWNASVGWEDLNLMASY